MSIVNYLLSSFSIGIIFLLGATGEIITEKVGHLNLGIPGVMSVGAAGGCVALQLMYGHNLPGFLIVLIALIACFISGGNDMATIRLVLPGANASEMFVSPAFAGSGELRAYIKIPGYEWWKTEFTLYSGNIFWREQNAINENWKTNLGDAHSVACNPGQKLYIDFDNDKGEVK